MIRLIISKEAREASLYLYKKIEERLEQGKKSILIVPEQYTLETDINFLRSVKYKAVMDAKVLSFSSFSSFFMDNFNAVSYTHLTLPTIRHRCRSRWSPYH